MGTEIPDEPLDIDPGKWYRVQMDDFAPVWPTGGCVDRVGNSNACTLGQVILDWIKAEKQCTYAHLVPTTPWFTQQIESIGPPHDTENECVHALY